jgi:GMP synthase (glutamine-hydrolysing)
MLLILNCLLEPKSARVFEKEMARLMDKASLPYRVVRMAEVAAIADLPSYSHLLLSGSEASALDKKPWDELLARVIMQFVEHKKPVLGICYGHQFLARVLAGHGSLRKSPTPEIGLAKIETLDNPLFKDLADPVSFVFHYDEVFNLPAHFRVIASTPRCAVHGFQYKDLPVWGVQFHPEYSLEQSRKIIKKLSQTAPNFDEYHVCDEFDEHNYDQIHAVIYNFLAAGR